MNTLYFAGKKNILANNWLFIRNIFGLNVMQFVISFYSKAETTTNSELFEI